MNFDHINLPYVTENYFFYNIDVAPVTELMFAKLLENKCDIQSPVPFVGLAVRCF